MKVRVSHGCQSQLAGGACDNFFPRNREDPIDVGCVVSNFEADVTTNARGYFIDDSPEPPQRHGSGKGCIEMGNRHECPEAPDGLIDRPDSRHRRPFGNDALTPSEKALIHGAGFGKNNVSGISKMDFYATDGLDLVVVGAIERSDLAVEAWDASGRIVVGKAQIVDFTPACSANELGNRA